MITFIASKTPKEGIKALASRISTAINEGKKILWLIAGGSNVPIAADVMKAIRHEVSPEGLARLTVSQTDERFGAVGHVDSNWQQMIEAGFDFSGVKQVPILTGLPLNETVDRFSKEIEQAFEATDAHIGQFGMGADGHIAGMLPHSPAIHADGPVGSHTDEKFTRVTITPRMFGRLAAAFVFVYGDSKREAVRNLHDRELSIDEQPAQLLKQVMEAHFYTDCLGA